MVSVESVLHKIESNPRFMSNVTFRHTGPAGHLRAGSGFVPDALRDLLQHKGIEQLYSHQAQAVGCAGGKGHCSCHPHRFRQNPVLQPASDQDSLEDGKPGPSTFSQGFGPDQVAELMAWAMSWEERSRLTPTTVILLETPELPSARQAAL